MNRYLILGGLVLLFLGLLGCTETTISGLPYTTSQYVNQTTDMNVIQFFAGDYNSMVLYVDGNKISVISQSDLNTGGVIGNFLATDGSNSPTATINWGGQSIDNLSSINDASSVNAVYIPFRVLADSVGMPSLDWDFGWMYGSDGTTLMVDWKNAHLVNNGVDSVDWANQTLTDGSNVLALDWASRNLRDGEGDISFDWVNRVFYEEDGMTPILEYSNGEVKISNAYTLPTSDGSSGQVIMTDGVGVSSWQSVSAYSDNNVWNGYSISSDNNLIAVDLNNYPFDIFTNKLDANEVVTGKIINPVVDSDLNILINDGGTTRTAILVNGIEGSVTMPRQSYVSAYLNAAQTIANNTITKIVFNTEIEDVLGEYDTSTGVFTAKTDGVYSMNSNITWVNTDLGDMYAIYMDCNCADNRRVRHWDWSSPAKTYWTEGESAIFKLNAGQSMWVSGLQVSGGNENIHTGGYTKLTIAKVA